MTKKILISSLLSFSIIGALQAQFDYNAVLPPSPTAAALGRYGDIPVSLYTGMPSISIPLWQIKGNELSLPISVSYMGGGIKVEEHPSWIGLGFSLNATGVITRTVRGKDDMNGLPRPFPLPSDYVSKKNLFANISEGYYDPEPDLYFFNFNGRAGNFVLDETGQATLNKEEDIKITLVNGGFTIIVEDGSKYIFKDFIENTTYVGSGSSYSAWYLAQIISPSGKEIINFTYAQESYRSYTLKRYQRWIRPNGTGYYAIEPPPGQATFGQTIVDGLRLTGITTNFNQRLEFIPDNSEPRKDFFIANAEHDPKALKEIIVYDQSSQPLKRFVFGREYVETELHYANHHVSDPPADATSDYANYRMYLKSITEYSGDMSEHKPPHTFEYSGRTSNNRDLLPNRLSYAQDHWGYYNGKTSNADLWPKYDGPFGTFDKDFNVLDFCPGFSSYYSTQQLSVPGADRSPSYPHMEYGTLKSIHYPTGGRTDFEFDSPQYQFVSGTGKYITKRVDGGAQVHVLTEDNFLEAEETVTIDQPTATFTFEFRVTSCMDPDSHQEIDCGEQNAVINYDKYNGNRISVFDANNTEVAWVQRIDNGFGLYKYYSPTYWQSGGPGFVNQIQPDGGGYIEGSLVLNLTPGIYKVKVTKGANSDTDISGWLYYSKSVEINPEVDHITETAGGLRVKKIQHFDESGNIADTKLYDYGPGVLLNKPKYSTYTYNPQGTPTWIQECPNLITDVTIQTGITTLPLMLVTGFQVIHYRHIGDYGFDPFPYLEISSGSHIELGMTQGAPVGYEWVVEKSMGNGSKKYEYTTGKDFPDINLNDSWTVNRLIWDESGIANTSDLETQYAMQIPTWPFLPQKNMDRKRGFLKKMTVYNEAGVELFVQENEPEIDDTKEVPGIRVVKNRITVPYITASAQGVEETRTGTFTYFLYNTYSYSSGFVNTATQVEQSIEPITGNELVKQTNFFYNGNGHRFLTKQIQQESDGSSTITEMKYPDDYTNITDPNHPVFMMKKANRHMPGAVIEQRIFKDGTLIDGGLTKFGNFSSIHQPLSFVAPSSFYKLKSNSIIGWTADPSNPDPSGYDKEFDYHFNTHSCIDEVTGRDGVSTAFYWNNDYTFLMAKAVNAKKDKIFYTGFEDEITNISTDAKTGKKSYTSTYIVVLPSAGTYQLTYWKKTGAGLWTLIEVPNITSNQSIGGGAGVLIDEVRLYPKDAQMTTFTYDPMIGITSQTDTNNITSYYQYDKLGRLQVIKDDKGNIVKTFNYHYRQ